METENRKILLEVKNLSTFFKAPKGEIKAVNGVSFEIKEGETLGIIGESGCGKSVTASSIMRIIPSPPGRIANGEILFRCSDNGSDENIVDLAKLKANGDEMRKIRGRHISMIFQTPMSSFSPVHSVGKQIVEAILLHRDIKKSDAMNYAVGLLGRVGIPQPERTFNAYPYQLSGGMCQRAMIAMALSCNPRLLIADEPTTAVDVTIQAQIIQLLRSIQEVTGMSIFFITHDLGLIAQIAHKVAVMYLGVIVEYASVEELFSNPVHPYTRALWRSIPGMEGESTRLAPIKGNVPNEAEYPKGCVFRTRCEEKLCICDEYLNIPDMTEVSKGHFVRCYHYSNSTNKGG